MLEKIMDGIVVAPNYIKTNLLKEISSQKKLRHLKIMNKSEFIQTYFGSYKEESLYFLMKKHNLNYDNAQKILNNIYLKEGSIKFYYEELKTNELLIEANQLKENVTIIAYTFDPYILKKINHYEIINEKEKKLTKDIYEYETQTAELTSLAQNIINTLKKTNINDIFICLPKDYYPELKRVFKIFHIPLNLNSDSLYSNKDIQTFLTNLKETKNLNESLDKIISDEIKNKVIDILNNTYIPEVDDIFIQLIEGKLKNITIKKDMIDAIKVIQLDEITDPHKYYYILGFNQTIIPHIYKDDDIISDEEKSKLNLLTSQEKTKLAKEKIIRLIHNYPNLQISYKLKDTFNNYYPSSIINELNLKIVKENHINFNYSHLYNKLTLASYLDNYFNYNEKNENLDLLYNNYNINYNTYDNQYYPIDKSQLKEYLNSTLTLSYTSLNNYSLCPFKYYVKNILKLEPYEETFPILIGKLFHHVLSKMYENNFDLKNTYEEYLKDKELTFKEKFYLKNLYEILKKDIEIIKNQEKTSQYNNHLTEKEIKVTKEGNYKITFTGIVDKLNYYENKAIIIDYKTGKISANLDNLNYGLNMQLPTYIYLIQKGFGNKYLVMGFYLQKILNNQSLDQKEEDKNNLKLMGYTINSENEIEKIDSTYTNSEVIKGLKLTQKGFSTYSKLISQIQINKLVDLVDDNLNKAIENIENANFVIRPKRINNDNVSCPNCPFKDLCFVKEEDIENLQDTKFSDIVGGE